MKIFIVTLFVVSSCPAVEPLKGIGMQAGAVFPEVDIQNPVGFTLRGQHGPLNKDIFLDSYASFWSNSSENADSLAQKWSVLQFGALFKYYFHKNENFSLYCGGGAGLQWRRLSFKHDSKDDTKIGLALQVLGGCEIPLQKNFLGLIELSYSIDGIDFWIMSAGLVYKLK